MVTALLYHYVSLTKSSMHCQLSSGLPSQPLILVVVINECLAAAGRLFKHSSAHKYSFAVAHQLLIDDISIDMLCCWFLLLAPHARHEVYRA